MARRPATVKHIAVEIDPAVHRALRLHAARLDKTLATLTRDLLREGLRGLEKEFDSGIDWPDPDDFGQ